MIRTEEKAVQHGQRQGIWRWWALLGVCFAAGLGASWWWKTHAGTPSSSDSDAEVLASSTNEMDEPGEKRTSVAAGTRVQEGGTHPSPLHKTASATAGTLPGKANDGDETWDLLLALGEFEKALQHYAGESGEERVPEKEWRKGLALEGLGRWDEAEKLYDEWEGKVDGDLQAWMRLGKVRCRMAKGDWEEARRWRAKVLLRSGEGDRRVVEECLILRAQEWYQRQGQPDPLDPLTEGQWAWPTSRPVHERLCEWYLHHPGRTAHKSGTVRWPWGFARVEMALRDEVAELMLTARWGEATVGEQLRRLCATLGWELRGDPDTLSRLETVRTVVEVNSVPLGEVLSALADCAGLHWRREEWRCFVQRKETRDEAAVLWRAWFWGGEHPWTDAVGLLLAQEYRDIAEGEWSRRLYRHVLERGTPEVQRLALYNWAVLEWEQGRYAAARARWYDLLDSAPGTLWASRAHWWLGRVALENGDLTAAEHHWQAVLRDQNAEWQSAALLGLAFVALLREDMHQVQRLFQHQRLPGREPYVAWADLLEGWGHYRRHPTPSRAETVANALERVAEASAFGAAGRFWAGQVWYALGQPDHMIRCYENQALRGRNPWVLRMWNAVADHYHRLGLIAQSRQRDLALLAVDPDGWGQRAALRLAEAAWQQGQVEECIHYAQRLRRAAPELQRSALLLLGRAYERANRHRQAAECFAGRWPIEE
ncbi:MAG: tetratricopeptide repeat protein [Thermogemmata sp.]|uniref:Tetratricopeptide repeat protein n=1 Tax=Thermogemmata fonticola TaxID=2755323 RepID=A0A7V8VEI4_9BACT|nr:tetratricopeptide repeat protein [Thermogemmata fonticola]MBA2226579.1 tetratricopeptide repeat protein [Thermogemmata fonticola]